ncbi:MAG TPA: hypothetical protein VGM05_01130, partial [Planctomycetaceae bacterium]
LRLGMLIPKLRFASDQRAMPVTVRTPTHAGVAPICSSRFGKQTFPASVPERSFGNEVATSE